MNQDITIENLKFEVKKFCELRDWDQFHSAKDIAIGIITEASELLEFFRFQDERQQSNTLNNKEKKREIEEELADILFFILRFSQRFNIDLTKAFRIKMDKNERNYPVTKSKGVNKKYSDF